jgi:hypothetical protein
MRYSRILKRHQIGSTGSASSPSSSPKKARGKKNIGGADEVTPPTTPPPTTAVSPVTPRSTGRKRKQISSYKLPSSDSELSDLSEIDWENTSVRGSPKKKMKMAPVVEVEVARSDGDE